MDVKPKKKFKIVAKLPEKTPTLSDEYQYRTMEEEVVYILTEWYAARGLPVPPEELESCKGIDAQREAYYDNLVKINTPKPAYGTPEFWKEHWAKKKAKKEAAATQPGPVPEPEPEPSSEVTKRKSRAPKSAKSTSQALQTKTDLQ